MTTWPDAVQQLHEKWGTMPKEPKMNAAEIRGTYNQIVEELNEWIEAVEYLEQHGETQEAKDMLSDVIVDLCFYQLQSGIRSGLAKDINRRFSSVWENNINKCTSLKNAQETARKLTKETRKTHSVRESGQKDVWLIIRDMDGKICKPIGWKEV